MKCRPLKTPRELPQVFRAGGRPVSFEQSVHLGRCARIVQRGPSGELHIGRIKQPPVPQ
jgi:hypothetical protein